MILRTLLFNLIYFADFIREIVLSPSMKLSYIPVIALYVNLFSPNIPKEISSNKSFKEKLISNTLFVVRHNKSPNYVVYQANLETNKKLNAKNPVDIFWFMKTKGEITEKVTIIEWKLAYGFELGEIKKNEEYKLKLHAIEEKAIVVKKNSKGIFKSYMIINGIRAKLNVVFINFETTFGFPSVKYLDFRGTDIHTNKYITERFFPE